MKLPARRVNQQLGLLGLSLLALLVGVIGGLGAVVFRGLIALIHNAFFLGTFSVSYNANHFTLPGPWGAFIILVPVIGAMGVTFLVMTFAPEARGHGVPEVLDAIYYNNGGIRPVVAIIKSLASALSIGTGGAVGREGPIIQIGATFGSTLGQIIHMPPWQRITLVAAGGGAGIAATFNTPIGGVMFALELMLPELSARTFLPVALATGTATYIGRIFFGLEPSFLTPPAAILSTHQAPISALLLFALLGVLIGLAATAFVRGLVFAEDTFDKIDNPYLRHGIGMLLIGLLIYALLIFTGHYYVEGVGYATIQAILDFKLAVGVGFLLILFVAKLVATSICLGSGASGGIFSPSLFMGATLGAAFGGLVTLLGPVPGINMLNCAIIGMAAMVGGTTGAAMTAVTMIFEMTRDYHIIMPVIVAVALSIGIRRLLSDENIYTIKLARRGQAVPKALHANMFLVRHADQVMVRDVLFLPADTPFDKFLHELANSGMKHIVVTRGDRIAGVLRVNTALRRGLEETYTGVTLGDVTERNYTVARTGDVIFDVVDRMWHHGASMAIVTRGAGRPRASSVVGIIDKELVADSVAESIRPYSRWTSYAVAATAAALQKARH